jgi:hypothetical protein
MGWPSSNPPVGLIGWSFSSVLIAPLGRAIPGIGVTRGLDLLHPAVNRVSEATTYILSLIKLVVFILKTLVLYLVQFLDQAG